MSLRVPVGRPLRGACAAALLVNLLCALLSAPAVRAATITVNSTADVIANDGQCTLREAIIATNTHTPSGPAPGECPAGTGTDTIILPAGTYTLTISGGPAIESNLTITGAGANTTIIDATLSSVSSMSSRVSPSR